MKKTKAKKGRITVIFDIETKRISYQLVQPPYNGLSLLPSYLELQRVHKALGAVLQAIEAENE